MVGLSQKWIVTDIEFPGTRYSESGYEGNLDEHVIVPRLVVLDGGYHAVQTVPAGAFFVSSCSIGSGAPSNNGFPIGNVIAKTFQCRVKVAFLSYFQTGTPLFLFLDGLLPAPAYDPDDDTLYKQTMPVGIFYVTDIDTGASTNDSMTATLQQWTYKMDENEWTSNAFYNKTVGTESVKCIDVSSIISGILQPYGATYRSSSYGNVSRLFGLYDSQGSYTHRQMLGYIADMNGMNVIPVDTVAFSGNTFTAEPGIYMESTGLEYAGGGQYGGNRLDSWIAGTTSLAAPIIIDRFSSLNIQRAHVPIDAVKIVVTLSGADHADIIQHPASGTFYNIYSIDNPILAKDLEAFGTDHSPSDILSNYSALLGKHYLVSSADIPCNPYMVYSGAFGLKDPRNNKYKLVICDYNMNISGKTSITCDAEV